MFLQTSITEFKQPTILIIKHFPRLKAAEHEAVERLAASSRELGWNPRIVEVDQDFNYRKIQEIEKNVDVVLDIHYEYPKFFKAKSIGAVWTPTQFMKDWDLAYVWENQLSHDNLVHTDSKKIFELISLYRPKEDFKILNHSLPGSWLSWINAINRNEKPRVFYAGINWDKLSGGLGRHHNLFKLLDNENIMDFYGPKKISHVSPWKDFKSYRGEIPFDGKSILRKVRESGISLVLSAEQHRIEGIITNRFFESLAAGNAIISDGHPFIRKHLGRNGFYLNLERSDAYVADQIKEITLELRENPTLLKSQQDFSQYLFLDKFDLTKQLKKVLSPKSTFQSRPKSDALVIGKSRKDINGQLKSLGFQRILHTKSPVRDIADVLTLARSQGLQRFCVFNADTEILEGFVTALTEIGKVMKKQNSQFATIPTVVLSQGGGKFSPAIINANNSILLNGLVVDLSLNHSSFVSITKRVPLLRIETLDEVKFVTRFQDSYSFLLKIAKKQNMNKQMSIRSILRLGMDEDNVNFFPDIANEIQQLPKMRKRVLGYSILASLPFMKPFVILVKLFVRNYRK